jgi:hypothetical protein
MAVPAGSNFDKNQLIFITSNKIHFSIATAVILNHNPQTSFPEVCGSSLL